MKQELAAEGARAIPPVTVVAATVTGWTLNDWVLVLTVVYLVLQIGRLIYLWFREK